MNCWKRTDNELPQPKSKVLVYNGGDHFAIATFIFDRKGNHFLYDDFQMRDKFILVKDGQPTYWMPLIRPIAAK